MTGVSKQGDVQAPLYVRTHLLLLMLLAAVAPAPAAGPPLLVVLLLCVHLLQFQLLSVQPHTAAAAGALCHACPVRFNKRCCCFIAASAVMLLVCAPLVPLRPSTPPGRQLQPQGM